MSLSLKELYLIDHSACQLVCLSFISSIIQSTVSVICSWQSVIHSKCLEVPVYILVCLSVKHDQFAADLSMYNQSISLSVSMSTYLSTSHAGWRNSLLDVQSLLTTMKQPIYNNRNATNDEKVQEDLVTKTNTLTVRNIEQDLQTVRSVRNTNMADYFSRPNSPRSARDEKRCSFWKRQE